MATEIYKDSCQKAAKNFGKIKINVVEELQFDGRSILVIGFRRGIVACDLRSGSDSNGVPLGQVMNWEMAKVWMKQHIGYMPTPDQIQVITLGEAENTPKGEPMRLETLAQVQADNRTKQQEQINDYVLKEKVLQEQKGY